MKRFFSSVLVLTVLIIALAVPVSAADYTETISFGFGYDYNKQLNDGNGLVKFNYYPAYGGGPGAQTQIVIPSGCTGRVFTFVSCHSIDARSTDSNDIVNGVVSCTAWLVDPSLNFATKTVHYANRVVNGTMTYWEYTYISPAHDPSITDVTMLGLNQDVIQ